MPNWNSCTMPVATPSAKLIKKSLPKKPGQPVPGGVARDQPDRLHDGDQRCQADGQRNEDEVVDGGDAELPP
jgi:hypothetical protein